MLYWVALIKSNVNQLMATKMVEMTVLCPLKSEYSSSGVLGGYHQGGTFIPEKNGAC